MAQMSGKKEASPQAMTLGRPDTECVGAATLMETGAKRVQGAKPMALRRETRISVLLANLVAGLLNLLEFWRPD